MKKDWKQFAEWLGVEYEKPFICEEIPDRRYKITSNGFMYANSENGCYYRCAISVTDFIDGTLTVKWIPEYNEKYYYPDFTKPGLFCGTVWFDDYHDKQVVLNVGIFKTHEEAKAKAIELGWRDQTLCK